MILYGEEATKQAQKEGEEAAAAYEQEKRDIAAGKIPAAPPKPEKTKRKPIKKKNEGKEDGDDEGEDGGKAGKKRRGAKGSNGGEKKKTKTSEKESIVGVLSKSAYKVRKGLAVFFCSNLKSNCHHVHQAVVLAPRAQFAELSDSELAEKAAARLIAARELNYCITELPIPAPVHFEFRPCAPVLSSPETLSGGAMLLGLSSLSFGWHTQAYLANRYFESDSEANEASSALVAQYGEGGHNESFRTMIQGTTTIIGCASSRSQRVFKSLGLGIPPAGGPVGSIDCHIGGSSKCCSETSASIRYVPTSSGDFQFSALSDDDFITMNGQRITPEMGSFPLFNEDVLTIGPRVFAFLLPTDTY